MEDTAGANALREHHCSDLHHCDILSKLCIVYVKFSIIDNSSSVQIFFLPQDLEIGHSGFQLMAFPGPYYPQWEKEDFMRIYQPRKGSRHIATSTKSFH